MLLILFFFTAGTNEYVNLSTSSERITCKFVREQESNNIRSCSASYGEWEKSNQSKTVLGNTTDSPAVVNIDLHSDMQEYCYEVTAIINKLTVILNRKYSYSSTSKATQVLYSILRRQVFV